MRIAVNEVGGAVERIDIPLDGCCRIFPLRGLFGNDTVVRVVLLDFPDNHRFGALIDIGDEIAIALLLDFQPITIIKRAGDHVSGPACSTNSNV